MIAVGRITKSVGIQGQVHVELFSGRNDRLTDLELIFVGTSESDANKWTVESSEQRGSGAVLKFGHVNGRTEADALRGQLLFVEDDDRIPLKQGTFFVHEITGLTAVGEDGTELGTIIDVLDLPAGEVWVLQVGQKEVMIPAVREFIRKVDISAGKVVIRMIEGLLE